MIWIAVRGSMTGMSSYDVCDEFPCIMTGITVLGGYEAFFET